MSALWSILAMGASVFVLRLSGLVARDVAIPPAWERALGFVPVALLSALIVANLTAGTEGGLKLAAAAGAGLVAYRTGRMWACILAGTVAYGVLRMVW